MRLIRFLRLEILLVQCEVGAEWQLTVGWLSATAAKVKASIINYSAALIACDKGRVATRTGLAQHDGTAKVGARIISYSAAVSARDTALF
jgi:hypothetical protein